MVQRVAPGWSARQPPARTTRVVADPGGPGFAGTSARPPVRTSAGVCLRLLRRARACVCRSGCLSTRVRADVPNGAWGQGGPGRARAGSRAANHHKLDGQLALVGGQDAEHSVGLEQRALQDGLDPRRRRRHQRKACTRARAHVVRRAVRRTARDAYADTGAVRAEGKAVLYLLTHRTPT